MAKQKTAPVPPKNSTPRGMVLVLVVLLAISLSAGGYFFYRYTTEVGQNIEETQSFVGEVDDEPTKVLDALKGRLLITETESPTIAKVEDSAKLQQSNPEFYKNAIKGDYVIGYPSRVIIFRLGEGKIINMAPIVALKQPTTENQ